MDLKSCSKCGKIHPRSFICKKPRVYQSTDERKLRNKSAWHRKSQQIRDDAQGLCEVCRDMGFFNYEGLEVHHITKLSENPDGLLDDDNLICLCTAHHKQADAGELDADYLRELVKERRQHD